MSKTVEIETIAEAAGVHRTSILRRAERECWFKIQAKGRGGKQYLYPVAALPQDVHAKVTLLLAQREQEAVTGDDEDALRTVVQKAIEEQTRLPLDIRIALCERELEAQSPALPAVTGAMLPASQLTDDQRRTAEARMALLAEIDRLAEGGGLKTAMRTLCKQAATAKLRPSLIPLIAVANARANERRSLSVATLMRWHGLRKSGGFVALAPKPSSVKAEAPWWGEGLLRHYRRPQKPALTDALEDFRRELEDLGMEPPTYAQARHFIGALGAVERQRGRMGPRELKNIKAFVKRDDSALRPLDIVLMDGHQYDSEVAHPFHGGPFRPEITACIDAKTRLMLGFSAGLAESVQAVMDALRASTLRWGQAAILYTDRGSGYMAELMSSACTGLMARIGMDPHKSIAYNSQARGRIERPHKTVWIASAKRWPTYIGKDMDPEAKKKVHVLTRRDPDGRGRALLPSWRDFIEECNRAVEAYNRRPHRSLPTITDPVTGKRRNQSPVEAWAGFVEAGWTPVTITPDEADDLFRPHRLIAPRRCVITLQGLEYMHPALEEYHGEPLQVAYEPADPAFVWVKTQEGRLICKAPLDGHKKGYMPMPIVEQAREIRAIGREKRLQVKLDEVHAERRGPAIEVDFKEMVEAARLMPTPKVIELRPSNPQQDAADRRADRLARWLRIDNAIAAQEPVSEAERNWHASYSKDPEFTAWQRGKQMIADGLVAG